MVLEETARMRRLLRACDGDSSQAARVYDVVAAVRLAERRQRIGG